MKRASLEGEMGHIQSKLFLKKKKKKLNNFFPPLSSCEQKYMGRVGFELEGFFFFFFFFFFF